MLIKSRYNTNLMFDITDNKGNIIKSILIQGERIVLGIPKAGETIVSDDDWNRIKELYKDSAFLDDDYIIAVKENDNTDDINRNDMINDGMDVNQYINEEIQKINDNETIELKSEEREEEITDTVSKKKGQSKKQ